MPQLKPKPLQVTALLADWLGEFGVHAGVPLSDQAYTQLRDAIVMGRIEPGVALHEPSIAQHLQISRTPVREALLRLRDDGLVEIKRQSGTFVSPVDFDRVEEGMIVRESLEPRVAQIAAVKMTKRILVELTFETDRMEAAVEVGNSAEFIHADDCFHRILVDASGFLHIAQIIQRVNAQLDRVRYLSAAEPVRARAALKEHRMLIDLLKVNDGPGSAKMLLRHLKGSWATINDYIEKAGGQVLQ